MANDVTMGTDVVVNKADVSGKGNTEMEPLSRYRWVVLAASFFNLFLTGFAQYQAGVMKVALIRHLDYDVSVATWLMSYYAGAFALTAPIGSLTINLFGCRACVVLSGLLCMLGFALSSLTTHPVHLFLTVSLIGIGQAMSNTGAVVVLAFYFPHQTSIATGVSIAGGALGIFVHPPLLQMLVDSYGLRGAFLLSGAVAFQGSVCGALMRPARLERNAPRARRHGNMAQNVCRFIADGVSGHVVLLTSWPMLCFLPSVFLFSLAYHSLTVLLPGYLINSGDMNPTEASFALSVCGIGSFLSRVMSGFLAHDSRVGYLLMYSSLSGVHSLVSLAGPSLIALGVAGSYAYCFMVGLYSGGCQGLLLPVVTLIVDLHRSSTALGMVLFSLGAGGLLGAPLTESIERRSQSPYVMFGYVGALFLLSAILGSLVSSSSSSDGDRHQGETATQTIELEKTVQDVASLPLNTNESVHLEQEGSDSITEHRRDVIPEENHCDVSAELETLLQERTTETESCS